MPDYSLDFQALMESHGRVTFIIVETKLKSLLSSDILLKHWEIKCFHKYDSPLRKAIFDYQLFWE